MVLGFRTNFRSTCPTMQALGRTSSKTCSSQLELQKEHSGGSLLQGDVAQSRANAFLSASFQGNTGWFLHLQHLDW